MNEEREDVKRDEDAGDAAGGDAEDAVVGRGEYGADETSDEEVVSCCYEDGGEDDEGCGGGVGRLKVSRNWHCSVRGVNMRSRLTISVTRLVDTALAMYPPTSSMLPMSTQRKNQLRYLKKVW